MKRTPKLLLALLVTGACARGPSTGPAPCPAPPDPAVLAALPDATAPTGDAARGATLFQRECVRCHAPRIEERDSGLFRAYPRFDCPAYLEAAPAAYLRLAIARGGPAVNRDEVMKPFDEQLSDAEIADLVAWLRAGAPAP